MIAVHPVASVVVLVGIAIIVLAGIGLIRLDTPYARIHAAGKASPVAFLVVAIGGSIELGWVAAAKLAVASFALILTLPMAVHLLFRALHRTEPSYDPPVDEMLRSDPIPSPAPPSPAPPSPAPPSPEPPTTPGGRFRRGV